MVKEAPGATLKTQRLVHATAEKLRDLILAKEPGELIGSLPDLAKALGVGVASVQQAARVLEHEGILAVRRGPYGGYFGKRPDTAALERSVATYLRVRHVDDYEALDLMTLLDCQLMPAAARSERTEFLEDLKRIKERVDRAFTPEERIALEDELHVILFRMVDRPLMELLAGVSMRFYRRRPVPQIFEDEDGIAAWRLWRHQIIDAILKKDPALAKFEAKRNRRYLMKRLRDSGVNR